VTPPENATEQYSREQLLEFYQRMKLIREFELRAINERRGGLIPGFIHSCVGRSAPALPYARMMSLPAPTVVTGTSLPKVANQNI
jgi:TPP-dependent pyruvate/acetoin dehydrogenase alpha subunit